MLLCVRRRGEIAAATAMQQEEEEGGIWIASQPEQHACPDNLVLLPNPTRRRGAIAAVAGMRTVAPQARLGRKRVYFVFVRRRSHRVVLAMINWKRVFEFAVCNVCTLLLLAAVALRLHVCV